MMGLSDFFKTRNADSRESKTIELLSRVPLFDLLERRELAALERIMHLREYQQGEYVFRQGERGLGMYIIMSGRVAVISEPDGHELSELSDGEFFGEVALLDDSFRSATVRAKTDCSILGFFQPDLNDLIARDPRLGLKIVMKLGRHACIRLRNSNDRVVALSEEINNMKSSGRTELENQ